MKYPFDSEIENLTQEQVDKRAHFYGIPVNGDLMCRVCYESVGDGMYFPKSKRLDFICSEGHENSERNLELDIDYE